MWAGAVSRTLQHKPARGTETLSRLAGSLDGTELAMMSLEQPTLGNACYTEHTLSTNSYLHVHFLIPKMGPGLRVSRAIVRSGDMRV